MTYRLTYIFLLLISGVFQLEAQDDSSSPVDSDLLEVIVRKGEQIEVAAMEDALIAEQLALEVLPELERIKENSYIDQQGQPLPRNRIMLVEAVALFAIGEGKFERYQYKEAGRYYEDSRKLAYRIGAFELIEKLDRRISVSRTYSQPSKKKRGLGKIGSELGKALNALAKSDELSNLKNEANESLRIHHENLAKANVDEGAYEKAIKNYRSAIKYADKNNDTIYLFEYQNKIAELFLRMGDVDQALAISENESFEKIETIETEISTPRPEVNLRPVVPKRNPPINPSSKSPAFPSPPEKKNSEIRVSPLPESYSTNGRSYGQSLDAFKLYAALDELEQKRFLDSIRASNQIEAKKRVIDSLKLEQQLRELDLQVSEAAVREQEARLGVAIAGLAVFIAVALFLYFLFAFQKRNNKKLGSAYNALEEAHEQLKTAQVKLVDSEKMASLGQLTAGIAHEINNPVNFISGNILPLQRDIQDIFQIIKAYEETVSKEQLKEKFGKVESLKKEFDLDFLSEEIQSLVAGISEGANRTTEIVKGLRNFARMDEEMPKSFDIHTGLDSTLTLLNNKIKDIEVIREYGELPEVECFPGKLNQVFMNVLTNAIQAMPEGGQLTISTSLTSSSESNSGDKVRISIKDSGQGIPEELRSRIFEPFFTTKEIGEGTGLGLSISLGIVEQHDGNIEIESEAGKGTRVNISIPLAQKKPELS